MPATAAPLNIQLRASFRLKCLWLLVYGLVLVLLLCLPMEAVQKLGLMGVWVLLSGRAYKGWRSLGAVTSLHLHDDRLRLATDDGHVAVELNGSPLVTYGLMILPLKSHKKSWQLVLLSDSADSEDLRRLRVWLSWRAGQRSRASAA